MNGRKIQFYALVEILSLGVICSMPSADENGRDWHATKQPPGYYITLVGEGTEIRGIVDRFKKEFGVAILGLEPLYGKTLVLNISGDLPYIIKKVLKRLELKNYAMIFHNATLKKVVVVKGRTFNFPEEYSDRYIQEDDDPMQDQVLVVREVLEGTTADKIGIQEGDIMLKYDQVRINHNGQLGEIISNKKDQANISLLIVRNQIPIRLACRSGTLGVVMSQRTMDISKLEAWSVY